MKANILIFASILIFIASVYMLTSSDDIQFVGIPLLLISISIFLKGLALKKK